MFEHSVKVPRHFKIAANIVKKVSTEGGSVKTLLYDDKLRHFVSVILILVVFRFTIYKLLHKITFKFRNLQRTNVLYALINETIKHAAEIDKMFENCALLTNEPRLDPWLAKVLTAELLFGKKELPGNSKPVQTILLYKDQLEKHVTIGADSSKTEGNYFLFLYRSNITKNSSKWLTGLSLCWVHCSCTVLPCSHCLS